MVGDSSDGGDHYQCRPLIESYGSPEHSRAIGVRRGVYKPPLSPLSCFPYTAVEARGAGTKKTSQHELWVRVWCWLEFLKV